MHPLAARTRRHFFHDCGVGLAPIAAGMLAGANRSATAGPSVTQLAATAKRVIYLFQAGAPSQLELFDNKPELAKRAGKPMPKSVTDGLRLAFIQPDAAVLGPQFEFARHGESGAEISSALPHLHKVADDIAVVRTVHTDQFNHAPAQLLMNTGHNLPGRPSLGSWLSYGLGSEADDLPAFVVLSSGGNLSGGAAMWGNGALPGSHQGVPFRSSGDPILHVARPPGVDRRAQRESLDLIRDLNVRHQEQVGDPEIDVRIDAYEMAFRMQSAAPELTDYSGETTETLELYGADPNDGKKQFANNCLLARRLAERGVRCIQVYHEGWDHHSNVKGGVETQAKNVDQASAALVADLKRRGLLEDTLVIWGGEFGRTPMVETSAALGRVAGRDHHPGCSSIWLAGGGIKPGLTYGETDDLGFSIVKDPVGVHDLHATLLHCLGIDHERLAVNVGGLDVRLTGVEPAKVVHGLLA
ncbi:DUF1501 domain-containing protein [Alienimonas chondri]|uniref:Sulfatase n=1 Tax=Alienimonas chondri TaxID=2681879 RepID=A0ABX1VC91_9PLAN|nr:DUF1501 domain-containing protein [Alienimonas chondri]NNJ24938.1 hypothetical protein [Alienimonas chondri]